MEQVTPWGELPVLITPHAPVAKTGRPPFVLVMMLRIHCLQQWFGLSDLGAEEALFETGFYRALVGISGTQRIADWVSILRFRHLLKEQELSPKILQVINAKLAACPLLLKSGTVVDATLIAAPSATKNSTGERDPEMRQTNKGNQWHFGMKAHIGVDAGSGLVHGEETVVFADAGYFGASKRAETIGVTWHVAMRPGKRKAHKHTPWGAFVRASLKTQGQCSGQGGASIQSYQTPVRLRVGALSRAQEKHGPDHHFICAPQYLDGQKPAFAEGAGMSASANSQRGAVEAKSPRI